MRLVAVDNHREGVHRIAVQQDVEFHEVVPAVFARGVVEARVTAAHGLKAVVEVEHDFGERQVVLEDDLRLVDVFHRLEFAALLVAESHECAHEFLGRKYLRLNVGFLDVVVAASVGELGGAFYFHHRAVAHVHVVFHVRHRRDDVHVEFAVEAFLHDFHVQQSEEPGAEPESERFRSFGLPAQCGVVQAELLEGFTQVLVVFRVDGVDAGINHRQDILVARKRFSGRVCRVGKRIADFHVANGLHVREHVAHHAFRKFFARVAAHAERADFGHHVLAAGLHHADFHAGLERAFYNADVVDDAAVTIVDRVENECLQGLSAIARGGGDFVDDLVEHLFHVQAGLGGNARNFFGVVAQEVAHEFGDVVGLCARQVHLVEYGDNREVVFDGEVEVRQRLRLDALACVHHEDRAFACGKRAAHFVREVDVPRGIDHVQDVFLAVLFVDHADGVRLDGDAPLAFEVHVVQQLVRHLVLGDGLGQFDHAVGERGFAVVNVGDNAEISDIVVLRHRIFVRLFFYECKYRNPASFFELSGDKARKNNYILLTFHTLTILEVLKC